MFNEKGFETEGRKERKNKRRIKSMEIIRYTENMTKDGIYCSYLKCVCLSKEKYYKSQDEYLGN